MNTFLFFRYGIRMLYFFSYLVKEYKYWKQSTYTANIVLLSTNQMQIYFRVSDNTLLKQFPYYTNLCKTLLRLVLEYQNLEITLPRSVPAIVDHKKFGFSFNVDKWLFLFFCICFFRILVKMSHCKVILCVNLKMNIQQSFLIKS